jgi:hypothetical protein
VIRNSRALSSIQRIAGGEMAVAVLVFEWACEVAATNSAFIFKAGEYGDPDSSVIKG